MPPARAARIAPQAVSRPRYPPLSPRSRHSRYFLRLPLVPHAFSWIYASTETWPSGRRRSPAKGVYRKRYRGFESLPLRQLPLTYDFVSSPFGIMSLFPRLSGACLWQRPLRQPISAENSAKSQSPVSGLPVCSPRINEASESEAFVLWIWVRLSEPGYNAPLRLPVRWHWILSEPLSGQTDRLLTLHDRLDDIRCKKSEGDHLMNATV